MPVFVAGHIPTYIKATVLLPGVLGCAVGVEASEEEGKSGCR